MPDTVTARLALPLIAPGQAQKEMTHNEALAALDLMVQPCVLASGVDTPPADPVVGDCWIVGATPTGAWTGHSGALAGWTAGGWRFAAPREGMIAWVAAASALARYAAGAWTVAPAVATIAPPAGGAVVDAEARSAIDAIRAALIHHKLALSS